MPDKEKEPLSKWQKEQNDPDVLGWVAEDNRQKMAERLSQETYYAEIFIFGCVLVLFCGIIITFIFCFETWAVDSPTGFWIWNKKWWGL